MKKKYHIDITKTSLSEHFSEYALKEIVKGNLEQDRLINQFGHDYIHFDGSAFKSGFRYLRRQKQDVIDEIRKNNFSSARYALGRVTHSWQDFYSHSNYVRLWIDKMGNLPPEEITIEDLDIIDHTNLKSGKNYGLIEFLTLLPVISKWIKPHMPADSHAKLNLDGPESGDLFIYAYTAALKQTVKVFNNLMAKIKRLGISQEKISSFQGK